MTGRAGSPVRKPLSAACAAAIGLVTVVLIFTVRPQAAGAQTRATAIASAAAYGPAHGFRVGVSVLDTKSGKLYSAGSHTSTFASESIVKIFIATRVILQGRMHGTTASRAYKMITQSDDGIATSLYGTVGGDSLITWIKKYYNVPTLGSPPHRAGWWGNTHITSDGLVRLYAKLKVDKRVGPWLLNAMHHATTYGSDGTYQFFGIPSATTHAAIKQGWGDDYDDGVSSADFNSSGFVNGDRYAVAILARGSIVNYGAKIGAMLTRTARLLLPGGIFPDPVPTITSTSAHSGRTSGGTHVTIHGADFTNVTGVSFGNYPATGVKVLSASTISVFSPPHASARGVYVRVLTTHGASSVNDAHFAYVAPPAVTSTSPASGTTAGGTVVTVQGTNFTQVTKVSFGSVPGTALTVTSATSLHVVAPAHAAGPVDIRVTTSYGTSRAVGADAFTYVAPAPAVTAVAPGGGPIAGGTTVTVTGSGFAPGSTVAFGTTAGTVVDVLSPTSLTVVAPARAAGQVHVRVSGPSGTSAVTAPGAYTYGS
jgi:hypothetical protein